MNLHYLAVTLNFTCQWHFYRPKHIESSYVRPFLEALYYTWQVDLPNLPSISLFAQSAGFLMSFISNDVCSTFFFF